MTTAKAAQKHGQARREQLRGHVLSIVEQHLRSGETFADINVANVALAPTIPETVYMFFQMTFAIITPALIAGALADRMKYSAFLLFMGAWLLLVYCPIAHWVWSAKGFLGLGGLGALDFAGGTVVHLNAGTAGLVTALMLGKRADSYLDAQRGAHLQRMRELTEFKQRSGTLDVLLADHALYRLEADLRWIDHTAARLDLLSRAVRR